MIGALKSFFPLVVVLAATGFLVKGVHWFFIGRYPEMSDERRFPRQLAVMGAALFGA